jgi:hypothetical protein
LQSHKTYRSACLAKDVQDTRCSPWVLEMSRPGLDLKLLGDDAHHDTVAILSTMHVAHYHQDDVQSTGYTIALRTFIKFQSWTK